MARRSKFFCIAVEGATCDGRTLDRSALVEMAETYDPKTYTARINMEHIRGFSAEPPFNAYGDVVAVETRDVTLNLGGKTETKLGLFAQVDALDTLVEMRGKGQKLFSSIELNPDFAGTGKAYLQGLAVTDSPASLGTEVMEFAAKAGDANPFAGRKVEKGNFFSAAHAIDGLEFATDQADSESSKLMAAATAFFAKFTGGSPEAEKPADPAPPASGPAPEPANDNIAAAFAAQVGEGFNKLSAAIAKQGEELGARMDRFQAEHDALKTSVETTERGTPHRPLASGQSGSFSRTDC